MPVVRLLLFPWLFCGLGFYHLIKISYEITNYMQLMKPSIKYAYNAKFNISNVKLRVSLFLFSLVSLCLGLCNASG